ncbi:MAG: hypothetical protein GWP05_00620 [Anaerolineaceae bacterium]|nr:hypothetical protein [Anaerolineaceae bacterium]
MMRFGRMIIVVLVLGLPASGSFGADGQPAARQADNQADGAASAQATESPAISPERVASLVADLGDRQWATRRDAEAELTAMGHGVLAALDPLLASADDPEVLRRLERIYRELVPAEEYAGQSDLAGFLGVEIQHVPPEEDSRLNGRENGLLVKRIVENSAARKAGLLADDLIVVLDGEKLLGDFSLGNFRMRVERIGAGGELAIGLYRGEEFKELKAVLTPSSQRPGADPKVSKYRWTRYWRNHLSKLRQVRAGRKKKAAAKESAGAKDPEAEPTEKKPASSRGEADKKKEKP